MYLNIEMLKSAVENHRKDLALIRAIADDVARKIAGLDRRQLSEVFLREQAATIRQAGVEKARQTMQKNFTSSRLPAVQDTKKYWSVPAFLGRSRMTKPVATTSADSKILADLLESTEQLRWAAVTGKMSAAALSDALDEALLVEN